MDSLHRLLHRRAALRLVGMGSACYLTGLAESLARASDRLARGEPAMSLILLWLDGGPSQLETFDPHPNRRISGGTRSRRTSLAGVQLARDLEQVADRLHHLSLVRSVVSREGDHQRGTYLVKTGYRPEPAVVHPSLGAICCHARVDPAVEIPRHISILPGAWPARGGLLGSRYDAFLLDDPALPLPDIVARVPPAQLKRRWKDLEVVQQAFRRDPAHRAVASQHDAAVERARRMMTSAQIGAFDVGAEPREVQRRYGQTPFGRGCLAARRLIETGVRCVEVTLSGWDSHVNNHAIHRERVATLDPALAALVDDLQARDLWRRTVVVCGGEFGRTPTINPLDGRDHWPHNFSFLLAGGPIRPGQVVGQTDPQGGRKVVDPHPVADIHATVLAALGIDGQHENTTPAGRPVRRTEGRAIGQLLSSS